MDNLCSAPLPGMEQHYAQSSTGEDSRTLIDAKLSRRYLSEILQTIPPNDRPEVLELFNLIDEYLRALEKLEAVKDSTIVPNTAQVRKISF